MEFCLNCRTAPVTSGHLLCPLCAMVSQVTAKITIVPRTTLGAGEPLNQPLSPADSTPSDESVVPDDDDWE